MDTFFSGSFENSTDADQEDNSDLIQEVQQTITGNKYTRSIARKIWETTRTQFEIDLRGKPYVPASDLRKRHLTG